MIKKLKRLLGIREETYHFDRDHEYRTIALQYYLAGRSAIFAQACPVAGNLFHHAIEMFLKFLLLHSVSVEKLRRTYRHDLRKLWRRVKKELRNPSLNSFDGFVKGLNDFEEIRYPTRGYICGFELYKSTIPQPFFNPTTKQYTICLEEVDEFVSVLLSKGRVTLAAMETVLNYGNSRELYTKQNNHILS